MVLIVNRIWETGESWSGWLGRRNRCSTQRGAREEQLDWEEDGQLYSWGWLAQRTEAACVPPACPRTTIPGSLRPGCHMNGGEALQLAVFYEQIRETPMSEPEEMSRLFSCSQPPRGTWMQGEADTHLGGSGRVRIGARFLNLMVFLIPQGTSKSYKSHGLILRSSILLCLIYLFFFQHYILYGQSLGLPNFNIYASIYSINIALTPVMSFIICFRHWEYSKELNKLLSSWSLHSKRGN